MTKTEILNQAVSRVSHYPQIAISGSGSVLTTSAEAYYNSLLPAAMESFVYGFGLTQYILANPTDDPDDSNFKQFSIPTTTGFIFMVGKGSEFPTASTLVGRIGLRKMGSYIFNKMPDNRLRVYHPSVYEGGLVIGYFNTDPDPSTMSAAFRSYLEYSIAASLALKNIQQKQVYQALDIKSVVWKQAARKFSIDNSQHFDYDVAGLETAALTTDRLGRTNQNNVAQFKTYIRGD